MRITTPPDATPAPAKFHDAEGCAARYGFSPEHWRRLVDAGKAPQPRRFGRLVRWADADLAEWDAAGNPPVRSVKGGPPMTPRNQKPDRRKRPLDWPIDRSMPSTEGERRRDAGVTAAACPKALRVRVGQMAMLDALLRSPDGTATIDDATTRSDLRQAFGDGGQWRGQVTRGLAAKGLIAKVAAGASLRPSRHAGVRYVWRLVDRPKAIIARSRLAAAAEVSLTTGAELAAEHQRKTPPVPSGKKATDGVSMHSNSNKKDSSDG